MPYSFSEDPSGSYTRPMNITDTWNLGLKFHSKDIDNMKYITCSIIHVLSLQIFLKMIFFNSGK